MDDDHDSGTESDDEFQDGIDESIEPSSRKYHNLFIIKIIILMNNKILSMFDAMENE